MTSFNNGKDLMPGDIRVVVTPSGKFQAFLGFMTKWEPGHTEHGSKFYTATADTAKEAEQNLVLILKEHLDRIIDKPKDNGDGV